MIFGDLAGTVEVFAKAPNRSRVLVEMDGSALGIGRIVSDQRFDGTSGYVLDSVTGDREITGSQLDTLRNGYFPTPLLDYRDKGFTLELTGKETIGPRTSYALRLTPKSGPPIRLYVDAESFLMLRTATTVNVPELGGDLDQVVDFSDYREVDGIPLPRSVRSTNPAQTITAVLTDVKHNVEIEDASFARP